MWPSSLLALLVLIHLFCGSLSSRCPQECSCMSSGSIFCVQKNLNYMPRGFPSSGKHLYVFQNNINSLQQQDFAELGKLEMLDLSQNALIEIPDGVFSPLSSLHNMDLSSNHITHISKDSFAGLVNLERLYLYSNRIQSIHPAAFEGLEKLLELKLQGNKISVLPALRLPRLLHLDLSYNSIPPLGAQHLQTPHLESLKIAGLGLTRFDDELLRSLENLHVLDVSQNQLAEIQPTLKTMGGLRALNLTGNPLGSLQQEDFKNLVNLHELDLSNLNLQGFPEGFFYLFPKLEKLTAAENPFNCLCPLAWFPAWLKEARVELLRTEETRCHFPLIHSGKVLEKLEQKDFGCPTTTIELTSLGTSSTTMKPRNTTQTSTTNTIPPEPPSERSLEDPASFPPHQTTSFPTVEISEDEEGIVCPSNICLNGGTCVFSSNGVIVCLCPPLMSGLYCEIQNEDLILPPSPRVSSETIATVQPNAISSLQITSTSILLDLHRYIHTKPQLRGIRLTYRNLSGPDRRPLQLNLPPNYREYTLRGLQPNSTYSVCASPLGEPFHASVSACMEARTAGIPLSSHEPSVNRTEPSPSLIPIVVAVAVVMVAAIVATVVVVRRRRTPKAPADMDLPETSPLELDGAKTSQENGQVHPKQPDITPCPSLSNNSLGSEVPLIQSQCQGNNNGVCAKPLYV